MIILLITHDVDDGVCDVIDVIDVIDDVDDDVIDDIDDVNDVNDDVIEGECELRWHWQKLEYAVSKMIIWIKLSMIIVLITHDVDDGVCDDVDVIDDDVDDVDDDVIDDVDDVIDDVDDVDDDVIEGELRSASRYESSVSIAGQTSRSLSDLRLPSGWLNVTSMHWSLPVPVSTSFAIA
jgi:hypothetical protein